MPNPLRTEAERIAWELAGTLSTLSQLAHQSSPAFGEAAVPYILPVILRVQQAQREALKKYMTHLAGCKENDAHSPCVCGLDAAILRSRGLS